MIRRTFIEILSGYLIDIRGDRSYPMVPLSTGYLEHSMEEMNFPARAHDLILKVARTLADLAGSPNIRATDVLEAIQYRSLDRKLYS